MPVSGLIEGSKHLAYLALIVVVALIAFYVGSRGAQPPSPKVDTVYVDRPADFEREAATPDRVTIFDTTSVTVTDTVTVRVPESLRNGLSVIGEGALRIDRPLFSAPRVRLLRFDTETRRGIEETFEIQPPRVRISSYVGAHRNFAPDKQFGVHVGAEIRAGRIAAFGETATDPYVRAGLRYYITTW